VFENEKLKLDLLGQAKKAAHPDAWYLTNTSSIPIGGLDTKLELGGRIVGYHFYNPPAVQKLLELITSDQTLPGLKDAGEVLAKRLGKKVFPANDIAGFIGNGHFMRDGLHAIAEADRLRAGGDWAPGLYKMNRVSQEWLLRPMGIFQLIDYVGVDVTRMILGVMDTDQDLGALPDGYRPWKALLMDRGKGARLESHFAALRASETEGATLAVRYLAASKVIGEQLVSDGVALGPDDVNGVLTNGFYHLYGPINDYAG